MCLPTLATGAAVLCAAVGPLGREAWAAGLAGVPAAQPCRQLPAGPRPWMRVVGVLLGVLGWAVLLAVGPVYFAWRAIAHANFWALA